MFDPQQEITRSGDGRVLCEIEGRAAHLSDFATEKIPRHRAARVARVGVCRARCDLSELEIRRKVGRPKGGKARRVKVVRLKGGNFRRRTL